MCALCMQCTFDCASFALIVRVSFWIDEFDVVTSNELKYWHFGSFSHDDGGSAGGKKSADPSSWNWKYSNILVNCFHQTCQKKKEACPHGDLKFLFQRKMSFKPCCSHSGFIGYAVEKLCFCVSYNRHVTYCYLCIDITQPLYSQFSFFAYKIVLPLIPESFHLALLSRRILSEPICLHGLEDMSPSTWGFASVYWTPMMWYCFADSEGINPEWYIYIFFFWPLKSLTLKNIRPNQVNVASWTLRNAATYTVKKKNPTKKTQKNDLQC